MNKQTEAERLAEILEQTDQMHENADISSKETAAELRRLSAINAELVQALTELTVSMKIAQANMRHAAKHDCSWEGCAETLQPRVDVAEQALEKAKQ